MSQEVKDFSLDIILSQLNLKDLKDIDTDQLVIEIKFDDIKFNVTQSCININNFREGRNVELTSSVQELKRKLTNNPVILGVFKGQKGDDSLLGEGSCVWPKILLDKLEKNDLSTYPHFQVCDLKLNGEIIGDIKLGLLLHCSCKEFDFPDSGKPYVDKNRNLGIFDEVSKIIDQKDIFFVVGSNENAQQFSNIEQVSDNENEPYPVRLNTQRFKSIRGNLIANCSMIEKPGCGDSKVNGQNVKNVQDCECNNCDCCSNCQEVFGFIGNNFEDEESDQKHKNLSSESSSTNMNCKILFKRKKRKIPYKERCRCRKFFLSSDSEEGQLKDVLEPKLQAIHKKQTDYAAINKKPDVKNLPVLPPRCCEFCCEDLTYEQTNALCKKCGQKQKVLTVSHETIVETWGKDEKTFIENQGFSKYDHCTCTKESGQECIYCMINQMRAKQPIPSFRDIVQDAEDKRESQVENVCNEILLKHQNPLDREPSVRSKKVGGLNNIPVLSKMVDWLKDKCSVLRVSRLNAGIEPNTKRNKNVLNKATRNFSRGSKQLKRISFGTMNRRSFSEQHNRGSALGYMERGKVKRLSNFHKQVVNSKAKTQSPKKIENLVKNTFKSDDEQNEKMEEVNCVLKDMGMDPKLKKAMQKLCSFDPASVWTKPAPKPLTKIQYIRKMKRKFGHKYCYPKSGQQPPSAFERHRHCLKYVPSVPAKMGWLWTLQTCEVQKGWRPGRLRRSIRELMQYFLREFPIDNLPTTQEIRARQRRPLPEQPEEPLIQKSTLHVRKHDGQYLITMNPLKDARTLQSSADPYAGSKPIQFKIAKNPSEVKRREVKRYLKQIGFVKCSCGRPVSSCTCRSFMEKERLDKSIGSLAAMLKVHDLKDIVTLSDTTESDSQLDLEFTPPAGLIKPHLRKRGNMASQSTQYEEADYTFKRRVRTYEMIKEERKLKMERKECPGPIKNAQCKRKEEPKPEKPKRYRTKTVETPKQKEGRQAEPKEPNRRPKLSPDEATIEVPRIRGQVRPAPPILGFAKNPISPKPQLKPTAGKNPIGIKSRPVSSPKPRARGGANILTVGPPITLKGPTRKPFNTLQSKENVLSARSVPETPFRTTNPTRKTTKFEKDINKRPPWDNSVYIPPALRSAESAIRPKQIDRLPVGARSPKRNYLTFQLNESIVRSKQPLQKSSNIENKEKITAAGNTKTSAAINTTSIFHRRCLHLVNSPLKEFNKQSVAVR